MFKIFDVLEELIKKSATIKAQATDKSVVLRDGACLGLNEAIRIIKREFIESTNFTIQIEPEEEIKIYKLLDDYEKIIDEENPCNLIEENSK